MLDKIALENYRKKIIDELGRKDDPTSDKNQINVFRNNSDAHRNHQNSRFLPPNRQQPHRGGFRINHNDQMRRNNSRGGGVNRMMFMDRVRNNANRDREK